MKVPSTSHRFTPCEECPLNQRRAFRALSADEVAFVKWFKSNEIVAAQGSTIIEEGAECSHLYTVLSGWAFRYKSLPDGRRQILSFALPGDLLGIQGSTMTEMNHSVEALTRTVLCVFPRERLWTLYEKHPSLAFDLTWIVARSECMLDDSLLSLGQRSARERIAYLLLHLFHRAGAVGMTEGTRIRFPFTQQHLADALGLSLVHTNKSLRRLAAAGAIAWHDGVFQLSDEALLSSIASYEPPVSTARPFI